MNTKETDDRIESSVCSETKQGGFTGMITSWRRLVLKRKKGSLTLY